MYTSVRLSNSERYTLIDSDTILEGSYHLDSIGYARDSKKRLLHRQVMNCEQRTDIVVDHINSDKLDNRRENLRLATVAENNLNRRPMAKKELALKNVYATKTKNSVNYRVKLGYNKQLTSFGTYEDCELATTVADMAVLCTHGSFGRTNRPRELYKSRDWVSEMSGYFVEEYQLTVEGLLIVRDNQRELAAAAEMSIRSLFRLMASGEKSMILRGRTINFLGMHRKELTMKQLFDSIGLVL